MPQPPDNQQLPIGLEDQLAGTPSNTDDVVQDLKAKIDTLQDALETEQEKTAKLEAESKVMRDNFPIKRSAVTYAKIAILLIPTVCLILLFGSANKGLMINIASNHLSVFWAIEVNAYAQSALIIGPIIFVATILGFLLKGVFGQSSEERPISLPEMIAVLGSQNK